QAPTPHGAVVSRWRRGPGDRSFTITAGGPRGTSGTVAVPLLGAGRTIARDGVVVWRSGRAVVRRIHAASDGAYVRFRGVRGIHTFAWTARAVHRRT
ncbi:MAG: alpha-L-rhamnosidase, partial [Solirubrobacteraceae bacterium]|nr:alpha-L-rhamnosidase [Solirubrobacteraceae bacterium]